MAAEITDEMVKEFLEESYPAMKSWWEEFKKAKQNQQKQPAFNWVVFTKDGFGFPTWVPKDWRWDYGMNWDESVKTFAIKQDAVDFIVMNSPCLSLNDIKRWLEKHFNYPDGINVNELKEMVRQKINNP